MVENDQRYVQLDTCVDVLVCAGRPESGIGAAEVDSERTTSQGAQSLYHHDQLAAGSGDAPSTPNPPALVQAAASCSCAMKPIPAPTNGCRTPYSRVKRASRAGAAR